MSEERPFRVHVGGNSYRQFKLLREAMDFCQQEFERTGIVLSIVTPGGSPMTVEDLQRNATNFYTRIGAAIERYGHTVISVFGEEDRSSFFYSIGLAAAQLPELVVVAALYPDTGTHAVNRAAICMRKQERAFHEGEEFDIGFSTPVRAHNPKNLANTRRQYTRQAGQYWRREDYPVQQIIFPDANGKWPGQQGYNMHTQPLL